MEPRKHATHFGDKSAAAKGCDQTLLELELEICGESRLFKNCLYIEKSRQIITEHHDIVGACAGQSRTLAIDTVLHFPQERIKRQSMEPERGHPCIMPERSQNKNWRGPASREASAAARVSRG